jgi:mycoredoxin
MNLDLMLLLVLAGASIVAGLISSLLYIVAGFRTSVGWGIANLLPLGSLIFTICRWDAAKRPFILSLVSGLLAFGTFTLFGDRLNEGNLITAETLAQFVKSGKPSEASGEADVDNLTRLRDQELIFEERVGATTAELKAMYADLLAKRKSLPPGNEEAVRQFNQEAARYSEAKRQLGENRTELERIRNAISKAVDEKAADTTAGSDPQITVYSTSWCGPCKMAKAHLKKRGVPFKEIDVEKSPEGAREFRKLGGGGVPLIVINGEKIRGFNARRIDALLNRS